MFCYVDRYFVILFRLLHFLFQRDLVLFHWFLYMTSFHRNRYTQIIYIYIYIITDYIIYVYMRHICLCIHTHICMYICMCIYIYIYICAVIPHTALLSHSELPQGKFLHRDSPNSCVNCVACSSLIVQTQCDLKPFAHFERLRESMHVMPNLSWQARHQLEIGL